MPPPQAGTSAGSQENGVGEYANLVLTLVVELFHDGFRVWSPRSGFPRSLKLYSAQNRGLLQKMDQLHILPSEFLNQLKQEGGELVMYNGGVVAEMRDYKPRKFESVFGVSANAAPTLSRSSSSSSMHDGPTRTFRAMLQLPSPVMTQDITGQGAQVQPPTPQVKQVKGRQSAAAKAAAALAQSQAQQQQQQQQQQQLIGTEERLLHQAHSAQNIVVDPQAMGALSPQLGYAGQQQPQQQQFSKG